MKTYRVTCIVSQNIRAEDEEAAEHIFIQEFRDGAFDPGHADLETEEAE